MNSSHQIFNLDKLIGRENFTTWKFSVKTYLEHEDLWQCVEAKDNKPIDTSKDIKAKSKLILLLDPQNYVHVQSCKTAKEVWDSLQRAFDDNGLTRRVGLLKDLVNTTLESSGNVESYVNKIMTTAHKLRNIGFEVNDEWLGTLMLAGLPDVYAPMIMGLESSGATISADLIKTKLLQEVRSADTSAALYVSSKSKKQHQRQPLQIKTKGPRCYNCNGYGHFAKFCTSTKKVNRTENEKGKKDTGFIAAFSAFSGDNYNKWFMDSGASMHMTGNRQWMYNVTEPPVKKITVANKEPLSVKGIGYTDVKLAQGKNIQLKNVLYVPDLAVNLLSVSTIVNSGYKVTFTQRGCDVHDSHDKFICSATLNNKLYTLDTENSPETAHLSSSEEKCSDTYLWHLRMGHLNVSDVNRLPDCVMGVTLTNAESEVTRCISCYEGKHSRSPFKNIGSRATSALELVHSDICGPMETLSCSGMKYYITFIDDYTRVVYVYFMENKTKVLDIFKDYKNKVENHCSQKIKVLRTDNGTEYCNTPFETFLSNSGIVHQTSTPYTPQHNGLAERMNRTLVEKARCMLFHANLQKKLWAEAVGTAAYILNRSPNKALNGKTPFELWNGHKPDLSHLRIFGSEAMVFVPKEKRQKWDKKSKRMILVGYCDNTKGYRLLDEKTYKVIKSRDVTFFESYKNLNLTAINDVPVSSTNYQNLQLKSQSAGSQSTSTSHSSSVPVPIEVPLSEVENLRPSDRETTGEYVTNDDCDQDSSECETDKGNLDETYVPPRYVNSQYQQNITLRPRNRTKRNNTVTDENSMYCLLSSFSDPQTVEEALSSPYVKEWRQAMDEEYNSLMKNNTWSLKNLPLNKKVLPCKWVYKTKTDESGNIIRFKARLVIKGYAQRKGTDYEEVFSPVVKYSTIRYLISLAARLGLEIDQLDAVSAFLQGDIDVDIYMKQPELYEQGPQVCHLHKSLYGLKQASRLWNSKLNTVLQEIGMKRSKSDPCVYFNVDKNAYIAVWVDDLILLTSNKVERNKIKNKLMQYLEMKDLGKASQCVGLNITRDGDTIMIDQGKYIRDVLTKYGMSDCKPCKTPIEVGLKFTKSAEDEEMNYPYQQAIGCLLYIAQGTRPDISFAVNTLSRFNKEPRAEHWTAVKRVMRYLQGTKDMKLTYTKDGESNMRGFCDADWASNNIDRKSCTGYVFISQGGAVSWCSRRQQTVALSTAEAEYMAMSSAAQEALWLRQLHVEFGQPLDGPLHIFSDNQSAIKLSTNDCYLPRSKHIDIRYHFLREHVNNLEIKFNYCRGDKMIADILTKGTTEHKNLYCIAKMGLRSGVVVRNRTQP
ncbi:unnamed protein product [Euphydryas editha]|uniref:Retrovirus-related Pol polyprotein from transposon TNT 1-94 n=1 Tax=Euphydryas editha TaxID=104508 RepID=A0AAU9TE39_EUPED|nr:unnamed protein product [Euphydryas editha]